MPGLAAPQAEAARRAVAAGVAASKSDHLAVVSAYNAWRGVVEKEGRQAAHEFCGRHFLADQALDVRPASCCLLLDLWKVCLSGGLRA